MNDLNQWIARLIPSKNRQVHLAKQGVVDVNKSLVKASRSAVISLNRRRLFLTSLLSSQLFLNACATEKFMYHSFSFNADSESPDVEVLNYQYGEKSEYEAEGAVGLRPPAYRLEKGDVLTATGVSGNLPRGDYLYVKWRVKETGQIYEDKVDLTKRLPKDITNTELHFVVRGSQLYVYLVPPEPAKPKDNPFSDSKTKAATWNSLAYKKSLTIPIYADFVKKFQIYPD